MQNFIKKIEKVVLKEVGTIKTCLNLKQIQILCPIEALKAKIKKKVDEQNGQK